MLLLVANLVIYNAATQFIHPRQFRFFLLQSASNFLAVQSSRLIHCLSELGVTGVELSDTNLADKLGRLVDLSDSVMLAEALRSLPKATSAEDLEASGRVRDQFLDARTAMVKSIASSFALDTGLAQFKLPKLKDIVTEEGVSFQAYQKFYAVQQSEMDFRITKLRVRTREGVSAHSRKLAQLAALDNALGDTLAAHSRQLLGAIPRLLSGRLDSLYQQHQRSQPEQQVDEARLWAQPGGWLNQFHREMQGVLLAELELRLQPIMGLIEALDVEIGSNL